MSNAAQKLRGFLSLLAVDSKYRVSLEELSGADMYYTDGRAQNCDFKLLFSENNIVVCIYYVYSSVDFFGTENPVIETALKKWIAECASKN